MKNHKFYTILTENKIFTFVNFLIIRPKYPPFDKRIGGYDTNVIFLLETPSMLNTYI